jgi:hypothetical protein
MRRSTSANAGLAMLPVAIMVLLLVYFLLPPILNSQVCEGNKLVIQPAVDLAESIRNYPTLTANNCSELVQKADGVILSMNSILNTTYGTAGVNLVCNNYTQFVPLLDSYNEVISSAREVNEHDNSTITAFYEKIFLMASQFVLVNAAVNYALYKVSFQSVGILNDGFKMAALRSLCGNACYSFVLHEIYSFIDNNLKNIVGSSENWVSIIALPNSCPST